VNWRWISLAALLAALVIGYEALMDRSGDIVSAGQSPPQPGYYLKDAIITETRADGSLMMRLAARRIEQQPRDGSYALDSVHADYVQAPGREWTLTARSGFVPADSRVLNLHGDVELKPADSSGATTFLRTDSIAIDTDRHIAYSTSSPATIRFGQHDMTVERFVADLSNEKIRLESANGRSQPQ